jgi:hypothetical protein
LVHRARQEEAGLIVAPGMASAPWVEEAARCFGVPLTILEPRPPATPDHAVVAAADRVFALWVRRGGQVSAALRARLKHDPEHVWVALQHRTRNDAAPELLALGATGWLAATDRRQEPSLRAERSPRQSDLPLLARSTSWPEGLAKGRWMLHATRARCGPLPWQRPSAWRTEVTLGGEGGEPWGPERVLMEILRRRLLCGSVLRRGDPPVVCFSRQSLPEFLTRRTFRAHRGRWDAEPYGLAVRETAVLRQGGRPVVYGNTWRESRLPAEERWRFQPSGRSYDWTREREWRIRGSFDLRLLEDDDAIVFVPDLSAAAAVAPVSPWRVILTGLVPYNDPSKESRGEFKQ